MLKKSLLTLALLAPLAASAGVPEDIAKIRTLLPAGTDVAQIQVQLIEGAKEADALKAGQANYLIHDFNGDGLADILVIVEKNPTLAPMDEHAPAGTCATYDPEKCMIMYNQRSLQLYAGQADGSFRLAWSNDKCVLNGDEGGVFGDPLDGFTVNKNGTISLGVYGGSAWRWSYTDTFQFRHGDFYVIGEDESDGWNGDGRLHTKSVNLLTGDVVETNQKTGNAKVLTKRYKVAVKPLVRLADYTGQMNN
jgi:hypothetical protein